MLAEIAKDSVSVFHLIEMQFSTPVYLTDTHRDITWNGKTYLNTTGLLGFGSVSESSTMKVGTMQITLSGVNQANISIALTENFIDQKVLIYRGLFDSNSEIIVDPVLLYDGRIDAFSASEDIQSGSSTLSWTISSHWQDFEKVAGRRTNQNDQQVYYPNDKGFEFASEIINDIPWGRV